MTTNPYLLKALALALAASQIFVNNEVKTSFDAETDQAQVLKVLQAGCAYMRNTLTHDRPELDKLDPGKALADLLKTYGENQEIFPGLRVSDVKSAYDIFCSGSAPPEARPMLEDVLAYYNSTLHNLPDPQVLVKKKLPEYSQVLDPSGHHFTDAYKASRRQILPLEKIPQLLQDAVIAAEDRHFYSHHGVDEHGLLRAGFESMSAQEGKHAAGGSTLTQQLVKNLLLDKATTYERKLREMVLANQVEKLFSKKQILEMYLNYVYLGRSSWGMEIAAQTWFGKHLSQLSLGESAFLAGMPKGPKVYNPLIHADLSHERTKYVLTQMAKDGFIDNAQLMAANKEVDTQTFVDFSPPVSVVGRHFIDELNYSITQQLHLDPRQQGLIIHSTLNPKLQQRAEAALQEGLAQYEIGAGRSILYQAEANLADQIAKLPKPSSGNPDWLTALSQFQAPLFDVYWDLAVVVQNDKHGQRVGLKDGRVLNLRIPRGTTLRSRLNLWDVVFVHPESKDVTLRTRPEVEGAVVIIENNSGRVPSMVGGFSHKLSELNRSVHTLRSPGSTVKPMTYLAALTAGLQPNTLVLDAALENPEDGDETFSPRDYDRSGGAGGQLVTLRRGLEDSRNLVTARLLSLFAGNRRRALKEVLELFRECGVMKNPKEYFSAIIGGQDTSVINMASCFATIANGGVHHEPRLYDAIEIDGQPMTLPKDTATTMTATDPASIFQLRTLMQGVVVRGTAAHLNHDLADVVQKVDRHASLGEFVGGKTGTSQFSIDTWFIGFTNDITIAVWVGYDNPNKATKRTLGAGTGASVAAPIWAQVFRAAIEDYPLKRLKPPSPAATKDLITVNILDSLSGYGRVTSAKVDNYNVITEFMKTDANGDMVETREKFYNEPASIVTPQPENTYDNTDTPLPQYQPQNPWGNQ